MYKDKEFQDNVLRFSTLLKAKEVAEIVNISRSKLYHLMHIGEITTVWFGKSRRVRPKDLVDYIKEKETSILSACS